MSLRFLGLAASCLVLAGCATVGPNYVGPRADASVPYANGGGTKTVTAQTAWWQNFGDATLNSLVETGLAQNLTVAQAVERITAARQTAAASGVTGLPTATAGASASAAGTSATSTVEFSHTTLLDAAWQIDLFGGLQRKRESALATIDAATEEANAARLTLIGDITLAYIEARGYQDRLYIARSTLESQRRTLSLTEEQQKAGTADGLDVAQAAGDASTTAATIPSLEISLAASVNRLGVLLGQQPSSLQGLFKGNAQIPRISADVSPGVPAELMRDRPDIRQAERQLAAATADIGVAEADLYPSLSLGGSLTAGGAANTWSLGPSLTLPIFNNGTLKANVRLEESNARQQYLGYRQTVLEAVEEVENALVGFSKQKQRRAELARSYTSYAKAVELSESLYQAGGSTLFEVLTAQRSLYTARDNLAQSSVALASQYIALCQALGGGWDSTSRPVR